VNARVEEHRRDFRRRYGRYSSDARDAPAMG
jgi:hypothetical protein